MWVSGLLIPAQPKQPNILLIDTHMLNKYVHISHREIHLLRCTSEKRVSIIAHKIF